MESAYSFILLVVLMMTVMLTASFFFPSLKIPRVALTGYSTAPRILWTYEPYRIRPSTEKERNRSQRREEWKRHLPDHTLIVLHEKNYHHYVRIPEPLLRHPAAHLPDLLCLYALLEYGGVWIDSDVRVYGPVIDLLFPKRAEGAIFYMDTPRLILPTVIVCSANNEFIRKWSEAYSAILHFPSREAYLLSVKKQVPLPEHLPLLDYILSVAAANAEANTREAREANTREANTREAREANTREAKEHTDNHKQVLERWNLWSAEESLFAKRPSASMPLHWTQE